MTVKELVSRISGIDTIYVEENGKCLCEVSKRDLDKNLEVLNKEVVNVNFNVYTGYKEYLGTEQSLMFTLILSITV